MQKIIIKNFGPVQEAEIRIMPLLVLIGEQASGKSTIAKLIYYFKSLSEYFFTSYYNSASSRINLDEDVVFPFRERFYDMFGSTFHLPDFKIQYWYDEQKHIDLSLTEKKRLLVVLSKGFFTFADRKELRGVKDSLLIVKNEIDVCESPVQRVALDQKQLSYLHQMSDKINSIFCTQHNDSLYVLAGRNATVGYIDFFENMLTAKLQRSIEDQGKRAFETKEQTIDETLMLQFMQRVSKMRQMLNKLGNFEGIIHTTPKGVKRDALRKAHSLINKVIRGQYSSSTDSERIVLPDGRYVYLKNASSGQQESIRILQDAFLSIYSENNVLRIIEEPEAHLFPEAQLYMIQLLVMLLNSNSNNQIVVTTHSPYILSVFNNLIYAHAVGRLHKDQVSKMLCAECWLNPEMLSSYMLTNGKAEAIIDEDLKQIEAEKIDSVSGILNQQYDKLMELDINGDE